MKTIYLTDGEGGWKPFCYKNLNDLNDKFAKRNIKIGGYVEIGDNANIGDSANIGSCAEIGDCTEINRTLFLIGSQHTVSYWGENRIQIGCKGYSISEWQKNFKRVGKLENYTDEQIIEYKSYIDMISKLHETWNINKNKVE